MILHANLRCLCLFGNLLIEFVGFYLFLSFTVDVNYHCFLFCEINARVRTFNDGYGSACICFYLISMISMVIKTFFLKDFNVLSKRILWRVMLFDGIRAGLLTMGMYSTCNFAILHSGIGKCSRESFKRIDFFTFTPKYVRGQSFPDFYTFTLYCTFGSMCLWLITFFIQDRCVLIDKSDGLK